jgi:hypothetical protein
MLDLTPYTTAIHNAATLSPSTEAAAENLIYLDREIAAEIDKLKEVQLTGRAHLQAIILETGQTKWATRSGTAQITAPSQRISYDAKALDALCKSNADIERILAPHRKVSETAGTLSIRGPQ